MWGQFRKNFPKFAAVLSGMNAWLGEVFTSGNFDKAENAYNISKKAAYAENKGTNFLTGAVNSAEASINEGLDKVGALLGVSGSSTKEQDAAQKAEYARQDAERKEKQEARRAGRVQMRRGVREKYNLAPSEKDAGIVSNAKQAEDKLKAHAARNLRLGMTLSSEDVIGVNASISEVSSSKGFPTKEEMTNFRRKFNDTDLTETRTGKPKNITSIKVTSDGKTREYKFDKENKCVSEKDITQKIEKRK